MGAGGEGDEHVEMQVAELFGRKAVFGIHGTQQLARFDPNLLGGRENAVILRQRNEEFAFGGFGCATPEFGQDDRRRADETADRVEPLLMPAGAQMVDEDRRIED